MQMKKFLLPVFFVSVVCCTSYQKNLEYMDDQPEVVSKMQNIQQAKSNGAVTSNVLLALDQEYFVNNTAGGEWVHFKGSIRLVSIFFPNDPVIPNDPVRIQTTLIQLDGVGGQSGLTYKLTGSYNASYNFVAGATHSFTGFYRLLPPSPIQPLDSYSSLPVRYSVTLNSDGAITEASAVISIIEG